MFGRLSHLFDQKRYPLKFPERHFNYRSLLRLLFIIAGASWGDRWRVNCLDRTLVGDESRLGAGCCRGVSAAWPSQARVLFAGPPDCSTFTVAPRT